MSGAWIGVASADHVDYGRDGGFIQVCHGRPGPVARLQAGDGIVCYSPKARFDGKDKLQAFTAIGTVSDGPVVQVDMGGGFMPRRRMVAWDQVAPVPIRPLLDRLDCTAGRVGWGSAFRFGLLRITPHDLALIEQAFGATAGSVSLAVDRLIP